MSSDSHDFDAFNKIDPNRAFKIYKTVHEMMNARGYTPQEDEMTEREWFARHLGYLAEVANPDESERTLLEIIDDMALYFEKPIDERVEGDVEDEDDAAHLPHSTLCLVYFFPLEDKLRQAEMNHIYDIKLEHNIDDIILVVNTQPTPKVTGVLNTLGRCAQLFLESELTFNVNKHQLVPQHIKVPEEEKEKIIRAYTLDTDGQVHPEFIPGIYRTDPVSKFHNWQDGDLILIRRPRLDGYFIPSYRIVMEDVNDDKKHD